MIPYKNSNAELTTAQSGNLSLINNMTEISRSVRSEIAEIKSDQSAEYANVNSIVKMITGQNIVEHTRNVRKVRKSLKEGESAPDPISVAQLDFKSRLGNFKSLIALLRTYDFYHPSDVQLSIDSLEAKAAEVSASLLKLGEKDSRFTNDRSRLIDLFDKKGGLNDRSRRAKLHVKRKYGLRSPEYKSLVNKKY